MVGGEVGFFVNWILWFLIVAVAKRSALVFNEADCSF